jgi:YjbE family integral membrane protein
MDNFAEQTFILAQIIMIDFVLAADNAIIIGMIASKFEKEKKKLILFWGITAAVVLRIIFALITAYLLQIKYLKLIGGIILFWVAYKLYLDVIQKNKQHKISDRSSDSFWNSVYTIVLADVALSLDNVLGVAGAAKDHYGLLIFGLILSVILMATAANFVSKSIEKYPLIAWVGIGVICIVGFDLILLEFVDCDLICLIKKLINI